MVFTQPITISTCASLGVRGMEYSDTVYLKAARKRERETKADDIIMRDEAILTPRVGGMRQRQRNA